MYKNILGIGLMFLTICSLGACGAAEQQTEVADVLRSSGYEADGQDSGNREVCGEGYESVEGTQIKMITENTEVLITLNDSRAAADLVAMLPLELTLIERNSFAKGMTLPEHLSAVEETTREKTIVDVIPLGHAQSGAEAMADEAGTVRLELVKEEGEEAENE